MNGVQKLKLAAKTAQDCEDDCREIYFHLMHYLLQSSRLKEIAYVHATCIFWDFQVWFLPLHSSIVMKMDILCYKKNQIMTKMKAPSSRNQTGIVFLKSLGFDCKRATSRDWHLISPQWTTKQISYTQKSGTQKCYKSADINPTSASGEKIKEKLIQSVAQDTLREKVTRRTLKILYNSDRKEQPI